MNEYKLEIRNWGYPDDKYSGIYIVLLICGKEEWESGWYELRGEENELNSLRYELYLELINHNVNYDIDSNDIREWEILGDLNG